MQNKKEYTAHTACLVAMTVLASGIIALPFRSDGKYSITGLLLPIVVAAVTAALLPLTVRAFGRPEKEKVGLATALLYIVTVVFALVLAADGYSRFAGFVGDVMLPDVPKIWLAVIFFAAVWLPVSKGKGVLLKFSLFAFLIVLAVILFFSAASVDRFEMQNIKVGTAFPVYDSLKDSTCGSLRILPSLIIIYIYVGVFSAKTKKRVVVSGAVTGCALLALCTLNALLIFGVPLTAQLDYPYAAAVSTVSLGELFTRMDGFTYYIYYAAQTVQTAVCVSVASELVCRLGEKRKKQISAFFLAISLAMGIILQ